MSDFEIKYFADKVHVHRWPQESPVWGDSIKKQLDEHVNKNPQKKQITVRDDCLNIENFEFNSLKKVGVSIPFFKEECTMILEAEFGELMAHVHITIKSGDYLEVFNRLILWSKFFSKI